MAEYPKDYHVDGQVSVSTMASATGDQHGPEQATNLVGVGRAIVHLFSSSRKVENERLRQNSLTNMIGPPRLIPVNYFPVKGAKVTPIHIAGILGILSQEEVESRMNVMKSEITNVRHFVKKIIQTMMLEEAQRRQMRNKTGDRISVFYEIGQEFECDPANYDKAERLFMVYYGASDLDETWISVVEDAVLIEKNWEYSRSTEDSTGKVRERTLRQLINESKNEVIRAKKKHHVAECLHYIKKARDKSMLPCQYPVKRRPQGRFYPDMLVRMQHGYCDITQKKSGRNHTR
jgi:hypothetical protein